MKRCLQFVLLLAVILFTACEKEEGPVAKNDSVTMGAGYANDIYYSLENGVIAETPRTSWDIAFTADAQSSAILINEAAGVELKAYPSEGTTPEEMWAESIDLTGYDTWEKLLNPDTTWSEGAFGMNAEGPLNYGWGNYNMATHNVEGCCLYIIKTRSGAMMKIFIETKFSVQKRFVFKFADLQTKAETSVDLDCSSSTANFVYYSLDDNERLDREPDKETWDILFTKFTDNAINYNVTGVLGNTGTMTIEKDEATIENVSWVEEEYSDDINIIGSDWKSLREDFSGYDVDDNRVFILKDGTGSEYIFQFTAFDMTSGKADFRILKK